MHRSSHWLSAAALAAVLGSMNTGAQAQLLSFFQPQSPTMFDRAVRPAPFDRGMRSAPPVEEIEEEKNPAPLAAHLQRQVVAYATREPAGTIVIDTANTYLYFVLGGGRAVRYGIGVGREGFTWAGVKQIARKAEWPDWTPPAEMIERQPYLPRWMAGGPGNPMGARAMYLGGSLYRIHGTNQPSSIGQRVSSGCIRMLNEDVIDLYSRADIGAKVVVLNGARQRAPEQREDRTQPRTLDLSSAGLRRTY